LPAVRLTAHTPAKLYEGGIFVSYVTTGRIGYRRFRQCRPADCQGTKLRIAVYGRRKSHLNRASKTCHRDPAEHATEGRKSRGGGGGTKELIRKAEGKTIIPALRTASTTDLERFPVACATASPKGGVAAQRPMVQRSSSNWEPL
jgi:hypothetical protein